MRVILVNGSPRERGNTALALAECAGVLEREGLQTEVFWLGTAPIGGCLACMGCAGRGRCITDDKVNEFLEKAAGADGFIFGTPVHYAGPSGAMNAFLDRVSYADMNGGRPALIHKPAAAVCVARRGGASAAWDQMNKYFGIMQMPIITSQYWNMVHGCTPGEAAQDAEGLQTMRTLAANMAFWIRCRQLALEQGLSLPAGERGIATNFIR